MNWGILLVAACLAGVAAAGVLWPFSRPGAMRLEAGTDPLDEERQMLLRTLRDLQEERSSGALDDRDYRVLRRETEARTVAVLRALEERDGRGELAADLRDMRELSIGNGHRASGRRAARKWVGVAAVAVALLGAVPLLRSAMEGRSGGEPITGEEGGVAQDAGPLAFFEQRVDDHPRDVAARLDLAQRYMELGQADLAVEQYLTVLELDSRNPEARAKLGYLLFRAGRPKDGLRNVEAALSVDPGYPEALYYKGVILLRGLKKEREAASAFRAYLDAAPFGSHRREVEELLGETAA